MKKLDCLRCGTEMKGPVQKKIQLGEQGLLSNHWAHVMAGALLVDIYTCPQCGKLEFFAPRQEPDPESEIPQIECPGCGLNIDFDYPKCPCCGYDLTAK